MPATKKKQLLSEWEAFTNLLRQLATIDGSIVLYPWSSADHNSQPAIPLEPEPSVFFDLTIYAPQLMSHTWMANPTQHSSIFLGSSVTPVSLTQKLEPWLRSTKQGLWPRQLPLVETTVCLGWLLFSAPEYNLEELWWTIQLVTGVNVALRYHIIRDSLPVKAPHQTPRIKAIHIEVDSKAPQNHHKRIRNVFSAKTKEFPTGIKMRLVAEISTLTSNTDQLKAEQRQALQAHFLAISSIQWLHVIPSPNHDKHYMMASLHKFLLHSPLPIPSKDHLLTLLA